jgi:hypothetical protein
MKTHYGEPFLRWAFLLSIRIWLLDGFHHTAERYCATTPWRIGRVLSHIPIPDWIV